jgi:threonine dehydrogenase-like Zn-dependent dehydrogenase
MCGTDLQNYRRPRDQAPYMPPLIDRTPIAGHEPAGIVCAVGVAVPAEQGRIGQRVMVHHYRGCTTCNHCRSGWQQLCQRVKPMVRVYGNNDDGGHAPYLKYPAEDDAVEALRTHGIGVDCALETSGASSARICRRGW